MDMERIQKDIDRIDRELRIRSMDTRLRGPLWQQKQQLKNRFEDLEDENKIKKKSIREEREALMTRAYDQLQKESTVTPMFVVRWRLG